MSKADVFRTWALHFGLPSCCRYLPSSLHRLWVSLLPRLGFQVSRRQSPSLLCSQTWCEWPKPRWATPWWQRYMCRGLRSILHLDQMRQLLWSHLLSPVQSPLLPCQPPRPETILMNRIGLDLSPGDTVASIPGSPGAAWGEGLEHHRLWIVMSQMMAQTWCYCPTTLSSAAWVRWELPGVHTL